MSDIVRLDFQISFHGPFHVARGQAAAGSDRTVDGKQLLPASSLKGLLRAEAREQLQIKPAWVDEIFGATRTPATAEGEPSTSSTANRPSPWVWSDADVIKPTVRRSARIRIGDADGGQAEDEFLMIGQHVWASSAAFSIEQWGEVSPDRLEQHTLVLTAAALSVTALGGARRRGEGWVSIRRAGFTWSSDHTEAVVKLREATA